MLDIRKTEITIAGFREVRQGFMVPKEEEIPVDGRICDGFVYILGGTCNYTFQYGKKMTARAGDLLYLADKAVYHLQPTCPRYDFIVIDFLFHADERRQSFLSPLQNPEETENLFRKMLHTYTSPDLARDSECLSLLYRLYAQILRSTLPHFTSSANVQKIEQIRQYIENHLPDPSLQISVLAEMAGMSEVYFRKLFRQIFAMPPSQYIIHTRIRCAKRLLQYTRIRLEDAAIQSGFTSLPYFCKVFKEVTGLTPSQYRKTVEQNQKLT